MSKRITLKILIMAAILITCACFVFLSERGVLASNKAAAIGGAQTSQNVTAFAPYDSDNVYYHIYKCENPMVTELRNEVFSMLGVNDTENCFQSEGSLVYVTETGSVSITPDDSLIIQNPDLNTLEVLSAFFGEAVLSVIDSASQGNYTVQYMDYTINGARVYLTGGNAAIATFEDETLTYLEISLRTFSIHNESTVMLLPYDLAAAASENDIELSYEEDPPGYVVPFWCVKFEQP